MRMVYMESLHFECAYLGTTQECRSEFQGAKVSGYRMKIAFVEATIQLVSRVHKGRPLLVLTLSGKG